MICIIRIRASPRLVLNNFGGTPSRLTNCTVTRSRIPGIATRQVIHLEEGCTQTAVERNPVTQSRAYRTVDLSRSPEATMARPPSFSRVMERGSLDKLEKEKRVNMTFMKPLLITHNSGGEYGRGFIQGPEKTNGTKPQGVIPGLGNSPQTRGYRQ
jgi:hypothetical protein